MRELSSHELDLVAGGYYFGPSSTTCVTANISEKLNICKSLVSVTCVVGNLAGAEAGADALGSGTSTQAISYTCTTAPVAGSWFNPGCPGTSSSVATSISASN